MRNWKHLRFNADASSGAVLRLNGVGDGFDCLGGNEDDGHGGFNSLLIIADR